MIFLFLSRFRARYLSYGGVTPREHSWSRRRYEQIGGQRHERGIGWVAWAVGSLSWTSLLGCDRVFPFELEMLLQSCATLEANLGDCSCTQSQIANGVVVGQCGIPDSCPVLFRNNPRRQELVDNREGQYIANMVAIEL
ncbi:hypothetical protein BJX66DRAFT_31163 [Aspergillus keveii]|uniref:Uncharacterized protein n=1 Tax=Aspergillus keveii TaxID=714993 RepID=A0ABR4FTE0_9EURO